MPDRSYLLRGLNDSAVKGYYNLMVESAVILGANRSQAEIEMKQGKRKKKKKCRSNKYKRIVMHIR